MTDGMILLGGVLVKNIKATGMISDISDIDYVESLTETEGTENTK